MGDPDNLGEIVRTIDGNFLYRGRKLYLIYKTEIDEEDIRSHLDRLTITETRGWNVFRCSYNEEEGIISTHILIYFDNEFKTQVAKRLDYGNHRPIWTAIKKPSQWNNVTRLMDIFDGIDNSPQDPIGEHPQQQRRSGSKGEEECRRVAENYFKVPFPNVRPSFLVNPETDRRLEIDCFNQSLKIGIEYDGEHHYKDIPFMNSKVTDVRGRDGIKDRLCYEEGILLIRVPYTIKFSEIEGFLMMRLQYIPVPDDQTLDGHQDNPSNSP